MSWFLLTTVFLIALASTSVIMRVILKRLKWKQLFRQDIIKKGKPYTPTFGGLAIFIGFIFSVSIVLCVLSMLDLVLIDLDLLLAALLSLSIISFLGLLDDILEFRNRLTKPLLVFLGILPLIVLNFDKSFLVNIPFIGQLTLEIYYPLLILPFLLIFCANAINILAGLDGLVPGMGVMASIGLLLVAILNGSSIAMIYFTALITVQLVLYYFNKYPSKVFPGNVGTLFIGAAIGIGAVIGGMIQALVILMIPYGLHFILYSRNKFKFTPRAMGRLKKDGTLSSGYRKSYGLTHVLMNHFEGMTEKRIAYYLIGVESIFAVIAVVAETLFKFIV